MGIAPVLRFDNPNSIKDKLSKLNPGVTDQIRLLDLVTCVFSQALLRRNLVAVVTHFREQQRTLSKYRLALTLSRKSYFLFRI